MGLLGKGALTIWHDIAAGCEPDYNEWHSKEHMLERVGIPGFRRGQRGRAVFGAPQYVNLYEVDELATLTSKPYLDRLNDPTPWSRKAMGYFLNGNRTLCQVVESVGGGICGHLLTLQIGAGAGREGELDRGLVALMPELVRRSGVIGAHYLVGDAAASRIETEEKRLRAKSDAIADRVVLVGGCDVRVLEEVRDGALAPDALAVVGAAEDRNVGIYELVHCIAEADLAPG